MQQIIYLFVVSKGVRFVSKISRLPRNLSWQATMLSIGGQRHCGGGDTMFLVVEEQDSTCSLNSAVIVFYKSHGIPCS